MLFKHFWDATQNIVNLFIEKNKNREFLIQATDKIKRIKLLLKEPEMSDPS